MAFYVTETPFAGLEPQAHDRVNSALVRRIVEKGEHIFSSGKDHRGLIWLRSGVALSYNTRGGRSYEFASPIYWGLWGAPSLFKGVHDTNLKAQTRCLVDWLPPEQTAVLMDEPSFVKLAARWTADDHAMLLELLAVISISRSEDRLMEFLTRIYKQGLANPERVETPEQDTGLIWPFTTVQLAAFLGLSRPHLSTILTRLASEDKARIEGRTLTMPGSSTPRRDHESAGAFTGS